MKVVTCIAPVNIAVIKYWGKRDEELILPLNDSISGSLCTNFMCAKTTIMASTLFTDNRFWLNGKEQAFDNKRLMNCLKKAKKRANQSLPHLNWNISICSVNNFPTAAGLASSAAGYACLVMALAKLYEIEGDISQLARIGSGSACRSVYGGWVRWFKGSREDGSDSISKQILPASHWPEMRILILVVNDAQKKYSSTTGMKTTVETSELLKYRCEVSVPGKIDKMANAITNRDFDTFADITMRDSNQFHAVCLDTYPPCVYMNDVSHAIVNLVHTYNSFKASNKVAYTFDAGPNACLYLLESVVEEFVSVVNYAFPSNRTASEYYKGLPVNVADISQTIKESLNVTPYNPDSLKQIIHTKIGEDPRYLENTGDHLLTDVGVPKN